MLAMVEVPVHLRSTMAMIEAAFGQLHQFSSDEIHALVQIMAEHGMSHRSIANVVAMCAGKPASDYADVLHNVSWMAWNEPRDLSLTIDVRSRLLECGFTRWAQEE